MEEGKILRERAFFHWLYNIEGIGRVTIRRLLEAAGSAEQVFALEEEKLSFLLTPAQKKKLLIARNTADVDRGYEALLKKGIDLYPASDPLYPERLTHIPDRPEAIYVKGRLPGKDVPAAAVIGARVCSAYGAFLAEQFAAAFAEAGVCVISGLARGIDGIGQRAALQRGGMTCAVLGCGPDICYPPENRQIYEAAVRHGAVISEYPPGTAPKAGLFPQRNRIISGLSDLILVIEAREKSGTLITVDMALEQGREVRAVPGRITDELSRGCNRLIWQGAAPALSPAQLLEEMRRLLPVFRDAGRENGTCRKEQAGQGKAAPLLQEENGGLRAAALRSLDHLPVSPEHLREELEKEGISCSLPELMQVLMELTLDGHCAQDGNRFCRRMPQR